MARAPSLELDRLPHDPHRRMVGRGQIRHRHRYRLIRPVGLPRWSTVPELPTTGGVRFGSPSDRLHLQSPPTVPPLQGRQTHPHMRVSLASLIPVPVPVLVRVVMMIMMMIMMIQGRGR